MTDVDYQQSPRAIHLFAGAGGGLLGGLLLGWRTVCAVEINQFCRDVLVARQNDGTLDPFPIWDDVRDFDGRPWRGRCDVLCGGFPCQNISPLGDRAGIRGDQSCLWCEFARLIGEIQPGWVFAENSADLVKLGLDVVLRDLASLGYDAEWECLSAAELGAPHIRDRVWVLGRKVEVPVRGGVREAGADGVETGPRGGRTTPYDAVRVLADAYAHGRKEPRRAVAAAQEVHSAELPRADASGRTLRCEWWAHEPGVRRVADGVANVVDRLEALGNGQVPYVAARAFTDLASRFR